MARMMGVHRDRAQATRASRIRGCVRDRFGSRVALAIASGRAVRRRRTPRRAARRPGARARRAAERAP